MNNKIIVTVVIMVILLGGGYFLSQQMKRTPGPVTPSIMMKQDDTRGAMTSLKELMASGKSQTCSFSTTTDKTGTTKGTTYISGNKMRTDFEGSGADGKPFTGSLINDGTYVYSWSSMIQQGMKIAVTANMQQQIDDAKENPNSYMNESQKANFSCAAWTPDEKLFVPPANMTFVDMSEQMKQAERMMKAPESREGSGAAETNPSASQCASCEYLQGQDKESCKAALHC